MNQEYARANVSMSENKNTKKETTTEVSFEIESEDITNQYTLKL